VPYWSAIQEVESKLGHITASAKAHEYVSPEEAATRGHMALNGFSDSKVIQDSRFRLAEALRNLGLAHSEAAKVAVQSFIPRPQLAIHGIL
jgi:hypothetical protein